MRPHTVTLFWFTGTLEYNGAIVNGISNYCEEMLLWVVLQQPISLYGLEDLLHLLYVVFVFTSKVIS